MSTNNKAKNVWWLYQARRVNTQTNAGGGQLETRIQIAAGTIAKICSVYVQGSASAGATLTAQVLDEDGAEDATLVSIAAGITRIGRIPSPGGIATTNNNLTSSEKGYILGPGQYLIAISNVALQNETLTVGIVLLLSTPTQPTWDTTGSAGTPSLAASTISAANTLQAVLM